MNAPIRNLGVFERLLEITLPRGGTAVAMIEAYFDESGSHDDSPLLCVAGYVLTDERARRLSNEWNEVLKDFALPYFRMSQCAHGKGPFEQLRRGQCIDVSSRMIAAIRRNVTCGFAVTLIPTQFETILRGLLAWSAYSFCAHGVLSGVQSLLEDSHYKGDVSFFFESGHRDAREADSLMRELEKLPSLNYGSYSHTFVPKAKAIPLQAADLLAWQWFTDKKHQLAGAQRRKDCANLLSAPHNVLHVGEEELKRFADGINAGLPWMKTFREQSS